MTSGKSFSCALLATLTLALVCRAADESRVLTRVGDIRALSREEAAKALPVRLHGVVIWQNVDVRPGFILHDGEQSIYVDRSLAGKKGVWRGGRIPPEECAPGAVLEFEGVTDSGGFAPMVIPVHYHRVGTAPLPEPKHVPLTRLLSGSEDGQRIEVEGVVQDVAPPDRYGDSKVLLLLEGHPCLVNSENGRELDPSKLVDAWVRVRGCPGPVFNLRAEATSIRLWTQGAADFTVVTPALSDPFQAPRVPLSRLMLFSLTPDHFHRRVTEGTVNLTVPGRFFVIQDGTTGVRVESSAASVKVGDRVEVSGFIDTSHVLASLRGAVVRTVGHGPPVAAQRVTLEQIAEPKRADPHGQWASGDYSGRVVQIRGRVENFRQKDGLNPPALLMRSDAQSFRAYLPFSTAASAAAWKEGSEVELTGVCELDFEAVVFQVMPKITGFSLWLRSPQDVRILSVPSWWTPIRLGTALLGTLLALG